MDIDKIAAEIHQEAVDKGFWDSPRNLGEMLMLSTSELAEALEEHRSDHPVVWFKHAPDCAMIRDIRSVGIPPPCNCNSKPEGAAIEVVDAIIRELDTLIGELLKDTPYSVSDLITMKFNYNKTRAHMHGKRY